MLAELIQHSTHIANTTATGIYLIPVLVMAAFFLLSLARNTKGGFRPWSNDPKQVSNDKDDPLGLSRIIPFQGSPLIQKPDWPRYWKPGKFQMTMALRRLEVNHWFKIDELYDSEHAMKVSMINAPNSKDYVDYIDGVDDEAVVELLDIVVTYMVRRYPWMFRTDGEYVYIDHLKEKYRIRAPFEYHPLAVVGALVMEDVYVLKKDQGDQYTL